MRPVHGHSAPAGPCILLVEDDEEALGIFEQMIAPLGFDVRKATTAEAALNQLEVIRPVAIIMDLRLPALDGLECLRRIRAMPALGRTPVTIITSDYLLDDEVTTDIERLDARLCFKPLWEEDLLQIVRDSTRR